MNHTPYADRLKDGRNVRLLGKRIDVTTTAAYAGMLAELQRLQNLGDAPPYDASYLAPTTREELAERRACGDAWAEETLGLISTAEYLASPVVGLYDLRLELEGDAEGYYRDVCERRLTVACAVPDPMAERSTMYAGYRPRPGQGVQISGEQAGGLTVEGILPLVPMAPLADELLVLSPGTWFAIPVNAPGVRVVCGEPASAHTEDPSHPLAYRYSEPDATVFLSGVKVPAERVFLQSDPERATHCLERLRSWMLFSANVRTYRYMWTLVGTASLLAEAAGVDVQRGIRDKLGELIVYPELFRSALLGTEIEAAPTPGGLMAPASGLALAAFAEQYSRRILDIVRELAGGDVLMRLSEADLTSEELQPYIERHLSGGAFEPKEKVRLFRLAWDLIGDGLGARRELYERWLRGDIMRIKNQLYLDYDREPLLNRVKELVSQPLPRPETPPVWELPAR